jgi:hypothetical protein
MKTLFQNFGEMKYILFLLLFLFLIGFPSVYCQMSGSSEYYWISFGKGFFGNKNSSGSSLYGSADLSLNKIIESADGIKYKNNSFKIRFIRYSELVEKGHNGRINELDILFGKTYGNIFQLSISGGFGVLQGYDFLNVSVYPPPFYQNIVYRSLNIPIELGVSMVSQFLGFGINAYANINFKKPIFGFIGKIELGKLR